MLRRKVQVFLYRHGPGLEVLLLKRARPSREGAAEDWAPVTGNVDPHENVRNAAMRECLEEVGLAVEPEPLGLTFTYEKKGRRFHETAYAAAVEPADAVELSEEHTAHEWASLEQALARLHWPEQRKALEMVAKRYE